MAASLDQISNQWISFNFGSYISRRHDLERSWKALLESILDPTLRWFSGLNLLLEGENVTKRCSLLLEVLLRTSLLSLRARAPLSSCLTLSLVLCFILRIYESYKQPLSLSFVPLLSYDPSIPHPHTFLSTHVRTQHAERRSTRLRLFTGNPCR